MKLHVQKKLPAKIIKCFYCYAFLIAYNFQHLNMSTALDKLQLYLYYRKIYYFKTNSAKKNLPKH